MARHDALFERPRAALIFTQHFLVVIRFDHERMHVAQPLHHQPGGKAEIGRETERPTRVIEHKTHRVHRIVRNRECLHLQVADREGGTGLKNAPVALHAAPRTERFGGEGIGVNRQPMALAEHFEPRDVVAVLVGDEDAVELRKLDAHLREAQRNLPGAQPTIDEHTAFFGLDQGAIPRTSAGEGGETEHGAIHAPVSAEAQGEFNI
ncbi:MAG: hypothetical protein QM796_08155 [Chthoniobacteraceae bacterium]